MINFYKIYIKLNKTAINTVFLFVILFTSVFTHSAVAQYTLTDDDVLVENGYIVECYYSFEEKDIVIPEQLQGQTITGIGDGEWYWSGPFGYKDLTNLTFPKTIEFIGNYACRNNNFTELSFKGCSKLTFIGGESFCSSGIQSVDFTGCESLEAMQWWAFLGNSITTVDFTPCPNLNYIGYRAFSGNSITSVDITACNRLKTIAVNAFRSNEGLAGFILPNVYTEGYALDHWEASLSDTDLWEMAAGDSLTDFVALYKARMKLATYAITYNVDGGTHSNLSEYTMEDDTVFFSDATKESYKFLGWYNNEEFTGDLVTEIPTGSYGNLEFWAKFEQIIVSYSITYYTDGGTHTNPSTYTNVENVILSDAVKADYDFMGWFANADFTGDAITEITEETTGDLEFWAKWTEQVSIGDNISNNVAMYPNPVTNNLFVNYKNMDVENISVINSTGQLMFSVSELNSIQSSIDMTNYKAGLYYVIIKTKSGKIKTEKIFKTN